MKNYAATHKAIFPFFPAATIFLERWLTEKAADGWRLAEVHGWNFVFRKCTPYAAKYFSYVGFGTSKGICFDYLASQKRYAHNHSVINTSNLNVYEVDPKKIDSTFRHYVSLRNKFYFKHYLALLFFSVAYNILAIMLSQPNSISTIFLLFGFFLLVYSLVSITILVWSKRRLLIHN